MKASIKSQFNGYNFYVCFLVSLGQIAFGYPASIIGTTLGEPPFLIYMGLLDAETGLMSGDSEALIGTINGLFQVCVTIITRNAERLWRGAGIESLTTRGLIYLWPFTDIEM